MTHACGGCHRCIDGYYIHTYIKREGEGEGEANREKQTEREGGNNKQTNKKWSSLVYLSSATS